MTQWVLTLALGCMWASVYHQAGCSARQGSTQQAQAWDLWGDRPLWLGSPTQRLSVGGLFHTATWWLGNGQLYVL